MTMMRLTTLVAALLIPLLVEGRESNLFHRVKRQGGSCQVAADIIFVLDSSGSIGIQHWPQTLNFVNEVVSRFNVGPSATQFGSVTFGNEATVDFHLNTFTSAQDIKNKVNAIRYKDENTNTSGGIWMMKDRMFTRDHGDRPNAPNMCIVITDGQSTRDHDKTIPYANDAKAHGIVMIVIGVGSAVNQDELNGMASSSSNGTKQVFNVVNYEALHLIQAEITRAACNIIADTAPAATPSTTHAPAQTTTATTRPPAPAATAAATTQRPAAPAPVGSMPIASSPHLEVRFNGTMILNPFTNGMVFTRGNVSIACMNAYLEEFRKSYLDVITRVNADIKAGKMCPGTPTLKFYAGDIIMLGAGACEGSQIDIQFATWLSTERSDTLASMELCASIAGRYIQNFANWRQPLIGSVFGCAPVGFNPLHFDTTGVKYICWNPEA